MEDIRKKFPNHKFELVKKNVKGTHGQKEDWYFREVDEKGEVIAHYHEWNHVDLKTLRQNVGVKKYGANDTTPPF